MIRFLNPDGRAVPLSEVVDDAGIKLLDFLAELPAEEKRQSRVALWLHYGLPADPLDEFPFN